MKIILFILICAPLHSFGQLNCTVKFSDDYTNETIELNASFQVKRATFTIDSSQNCIKIDKIHGNTLIVLSEGYNTFSKKIKRKNIKNDTLLIDLTPKDAVCNSRYEKIWLRHEQNGDTIDIKSVSAIQSHVKSIMNYLLTNEGNCGNGMCNYSNTYAFILYFKMEKGIYLFDKLEKTQPNDYECHYIEENLRNLKEVLPIFRDLDEKESPNQIMRFQIWMTYY